MKKLHFHLLLFLIALGACNHEINDFETDGLPVVKSSTATNGTIYADINDKSGAVTHFGAGTYFYSGHLMNGITNTTDAHKWIWEDLGVNTFRIVFRAEDCEDTNDNNDPDSLNLDGFDFSNSNITDQIAAAKKALQLNPNMKIWAVVLSPPDYLKTNNSHLGGAATGEDDATIKYIDGTTEYREFGEFILAHLKHHKDNGLEVDYLSIMNEPDVNLDHEDCRWYGWQAEKAYDITIDYLKDTLPGYNIQIPDFAGAEPLNVGWADDYISLINSTDVKLFTTHQYGGNSEANFQQAADSAGAKPLIMSEWHTGHGMVSDPDELTAALDLPQHMISAFRGGARGWLYFEWGNSQDNFGGLLKTPWGADAIRRKNYWTFKQFTENIIGTERVVATASSLANFSASNIMAFAGSNDVYIHVVNWSENWERARVEPGTTFSSIDIWRTSSSEDDKLIWTATDISRDYYSVDFAPKSFTTIKMSW